MPHLVAILIYLSQNYSYYRRGDRSPLTNTLPHMRPICECERDECEGELICDPEQQNRNNNYQ